MFVPLTDQNELLSQKETEDEPDQPPSPLSVQQGGGSLVAQCPLEHLESGLVNFDKNKAFSDVSDIDTESMDEQGTTDKCSATVLLIDTNSAVDTTEVKTANELIDNGTHDIMELKEHNGCGDIVEVANKEDYQSPIKKKSVQELYGQPSWWGDGEDNYSYPRTSLLASKDKDTPRHRVERSTFYESPKEQSTQDLPQSHPRAEAYVLDFGKPKDANGNPLSTPSSLSQCVPERIRRAFDERERQKLEREKQREALRRQSMQSDSKSPRGSTPARRNLLSYRPASLRVSSTRGRVASNIEKERPVSSPIPRRGSPVTSRSTASAGIHNRPLNTTTRKAPSRATTSVDSPGRACLNQTGRGSTRTGPGVSRTKTTPVTRKPVATPDPVLSGLAGRNNRLQNVRKGSTPSSETTARNFLRSNVNKTSSCTTPSTSSRRSMPPIKSTLTSTIRASLAAENRPALTGARPTTTSNTVHTGVNQSSAIPKTVNKLPSSTRNKAGTNLPGSNSNAIQRANTQLHSLSSRPSCNSPVGNSAKKPITSTQLRRPASSNRVLQRSATESNIGRRFSGTVRYSDLVATVIANIDAFEDPKSYLFYRMFQGTEFPAKATNDSTNQQVNSSGNFKRELVAEKQMPFGPQPNNQSLGTNQIPDPSTKPANPVLHAPFDSVAAPVPASSQPVISCSLRQSSRRQIESPQNGFSLSSTDDALTGSMLVSTSVTSLAPSHSETYILDPKETLANKADNFKHRAGPSSPLHAGDTLGSVGSLTPHGSLTDLVKVYEKATVPPVGVAHSTSSSYPKGFPIQKPGQNPELSASTGKLFCPISSVSDSAQVDSWKDDFEVDATEASVLRSTQLDTSALVSASVTSLTPSCTDTYVLDIDDTLASHGIPPVVIQSQEDLRSPTEDSRLTRSSKPAHRRLEVSTPMVSPVNHKGVLWDVLEAEECSEELATAKTGDQLTCSRRDFTSARNDNLSRHTETVITEEDFQLLPAPKFHEPTEGQQTGGKTETTPKHSVIPSCEPAFISDRLVAPMTANSEKSPTTKVQSGTRSQFVASEDSGLSISVHHERSSEETSIALKVPNLSSSSSTASSPTSECLNQPLMCRNSLPQSSTACTVPPAYAPLTTLHKCYRALQESVNYLIHNNDEAIGMKSDHIYPNVLSTIPTEDVGSLALKVRQAHAHVADVSRPKFLPQSEKTNFVPPKTVSTKQSPTGAHSHFVLHESTSSSKPGSPYYETGDTNANDRVESTGLKQSAEQRVLRSHSDTTNMDNFEKINYMDNSFHRSQPIDSRTFTRKKSGQSTEQSRHRQSANPNALTYGQWITSMTAISRDIEALTNPSAFSADMSRQQIAAGPDRPHRHTEIPESTNLPDSTSDHPSSLRPLDSSSVASLTQRQHDFANDFLSLPSSNRNEFSDSNLLARMDLTNQNAMYYTLMVNSIRELSFKLRQCSDRLIERVSSECPEHMFKAQNNSIYPVTDSADSISTYAKSAFDDALKNMQMINDQLKVVDQMLFATAGSPEVGQRLLETVMTENSPARCHSLDRAGCMADPSVLFNDDSLTRPNPSSRLHPSQPDGIANLPSGAKAQPNAEDDDDSQVYY